MAKSFIITCAVSSGGLGLSIDERLALKGADNVNF